MHLGRIYDLKGKKEVNVWGTKGSKQRVKVVLTVKSSVKKLSPLMIFKNKIIKTQSYYPKK